jgi:hypothetical protein
MFDERLASTGRPTPYTTVRGSDASPNRLVGQNLAPTIDVEVADFGLRISTLRPFGDKAYLRVSNFVMPNLCAVPGETQGAGYLVNWHVPIDDEHHWKFMIVFSRQAPLDKAMFRERYTAEINSDFRPIRNLANRYLQKREEMKSKSFAGLGPFFPAHDLFATESQGPIQNRTQEHPVSSDKAILAQRKLLLKAMKDVQEGKEPLHVIRDAESNRFPHMVVLSEVVPSAADWKAYAKKAEAEVRV